MPRRLFEFHKGKAMLKPMSRMAKIAFPLWNSNSLLGIFWGFLFFNELRQAGWRRWTGVLGGALVMCFGAALLAMASSTQASAGHSPRGVWAALGAGVLWGTDRKSVV